MKILLLCNLGLSSGILGKKIENECLKKGIAAQVTAKPMNLAEEELAQSDVVLISPQIRFIAKELKTKVSENVKVITINPTDFGLQKADAILEQILKEE